jgi:hypothetical protein
MTDAADLLGLPNPPRETRIVVAMSGGVDSSVVAALLVEHGYEVVGVTLQLYDHGTATGRKGACCAGQDIHDAARVAERLGIPHYVLDYESRFGAEVIADFVDTYARGETPIPCVRCNQTVKFRDLLATARDLGAAALATGHYVRRVEGAEGPELHRAIFSSRPLEASSSSCAFRSAASTRTRRAPWRGASRCPWRPSRTARISASCRAAPMPGWSRSCVRVQSSPATWSTATAGCSGAIPG